MADNNTLRNPEEIKIQMIRMVGVMIRSNQLMIKTEGEKQDHVAARVVDQ